MHRSQDYRLGRMSVLWDEVGPEERLSIVKAMAPQLLPAVQLCRTGWNDLAADVQVALVARET